MEATTKDLRLHTRELIAATAISLGDVLVTGNDKHYRMIDGLEIEVFRP